MRGDFEKFMDIRKMKIEDYDNVYKLWSSTAGMGMRSLDDSYEGILKFLLRNPETNFVVEDNGTIIGVILSGHDGRRGYIYHMAVDEPYRNKGIGRLLLSSALEALRNEGINKVALLVLDSNEIGNRFWERVGFTRRNDIVYRNKSINENNV